MTPMPTRYPGNRKPRKRLPPARWRVDYQALYKAIDKRRTELNISLEGAAAVIGITRPALWALQGRQPTIDTLLKCCSWLEVNPQRFCIRETPL